MASCESHSNEAASTCSVEAAEQRDNHTFTSPIVEVVEQSRERDSKVFVSSKLNIRSVPFVPSTPDFTPSLVHSSLVHHGPFSLSAVNSPISAGLSSRRHSYSHIGSGRMHSLVPRHIRSLSQTSVLECDVQTSNTYSSVVDLLCDENSGLEHSFEFSIKHGGLPPLAVRYIREGSVDELVKPHVDWMMEDCSKDTPCLGVDAETGVHSTRLLQISTRNRCLLIRIPLQSHTHLYSTHNSHHHSHHHHHNHHVRLASSIIHLLESRTIFKSGAELWGDALDLYRDLHVSMNAGLNMSWCHRRGHYSLSLEHMTNLVCGKEAFIKDKETTISDWDRPILTFRQLVYGALDAQSSFLVANMTDASSPRPPPFHCSDMSSSWLSSASSWLNIVKYIQKEQDSMRAECLFEHLNFTETGCNIKLKNNQSKVRFERYVYLSYIDFTDELFRVRSLSGRDLVLDYTSAHNMNQRPRAEHEVRSMQMVREREHELMMTPIRQYFTRVMHHSEPFNPFIAALLDQTFVQKSSATHVSNYHGTNTPRRPSFAIETPYSPTLSPQLSALDESDNTFEFPLLTSSPQPWWYEDEIKEVIDLDPLAIPAYASLSDEQRHALSLVDSSRLVAITGAGGCGKSGTVVAEILRSLHRRSIYGSTATEGRVLILCDTPSVARHLALLAAPHFTNQELGLNLPPEYLLDWNPDEADYSLLLKNEYVVDLDSALTPHNDDFHRRNNRRVLITTVSQAFHLARIHPHYIHHRPTLIFDEASQVWVVKALLLLRILLSTERVIAAGDLNGLTPSLCKDIHHPLSLISQLSLVSQIHSHQHLNQTYLHRPKPFNVKHAHLSKQYRMMKHLSAMISQAFYPASPAAHLVPIDTDNEDRGLHWRDVRGLPSKTEHSKSIFNVKECEECMRIWAQLRNEGFEKHEIVVLCFYEAQKQMLCESRGELGMQVSMIEQFAGRQAKCVILTLASEFTTPTLADRYRINVACSRAQLRLYIVGNRSALARADGLWKTISDYEQQEPARRKQQVPDLVNDFPSLSITNPSSSPQIGAVVDTPTFFGSSGSHGSPRMTPLQPSSKSPRLLGQTASSRSPQLVPAFSSPSPQMLSSRGSLSGLNWSSVLTSAPSPSITSQSPSRDEHLTDSADVAASPEPTEKWPTENAWRRPPQSPLTAPVRHPSSSPSCSPAQPSPSPSFAAIANHSGIVDEVNKPFRWRTSICHFYLKGHCQNGTSCNFAHGDWELRSMSAATSAHQAHEAAQRAAFGSVTSSPGVSMWKSPSPKLFASSSHSTPGSHTLHPHSIMPTLALNPPANASLLSHTSSIFTPQKQSVESISSWSSSSATRSSQSIFTPNKDRPTHKSLLAHDSLHSNISDITGRPDRSSNGAVTPITHRSQSYDSSLLSQPDLFEVASHIKRTPTMKPKQQQHLLSATKPHDLKEKLAAAKRAEPTSWNCPICTYLNDCRLLRCDMCDHERVTEWQPAKPKANKKLGT